ncbi:antitermination protein [Aeromonas caviae]|uniref:Antitermination protein n=1 Tax=Aeromonas caviae TaxID=648 RepID=A0ABU5WDN7_AERCA|nr:antitermination protein [Aeromonas caviae]MDY7841562.1 antitermination protein [Aeromonas caviae]MEA9438535.1 antitermination protein [Aeromonas caviae]
MTALGMVQKHNGAGMALVMARYCKDLGDAKKALLAVQAECTKIAPRYVGANKERGHGMALRRVAELALEHYCRTVDTPGAACHPQFCRGRGVIRDLELSRLHGKAIDKVCPRCGGTGLRPIPGTQIRRAIEPLAGGLTRGQWERGWYPLYLAVLAWCHVQESEVAAFYKRVIAV